MSKICHLVMRMSASTMKSKRGAGGRMLASLQSTLSSSPSSSSIFLSASSNKWSALSSSFANFSQNGGSATPLLTGLTRHMSTDASLTEAAAEDAAEPVLASQTTTSNADDNVVCPPWTHIADAPIMTFDLMATMSWERLNYELHIRRSRLKQIRKTQLRRPRRISKRYYAANRPQLSQLQSCVTHLEAEMIRRPEALEFGFYPGDIKEIALSYHENHGMPEVYR